MTTFSSKLLQSPVFSSCCIQVVQQLTKHGMLKARVIGNSQNSSIIEHTRDVAMKFSLDVEPIKVKRNTCDNPLVCAFICNTIYTEKYDHKGNIVSIKVESSINP